MKAKEMQQLEDQILVRLVELVRARSDAVESRGGRQDSTSGAPSSRMDSKSGRILENRVAELIGMHNAAGADTHPEFRLAISRLVSKRLITRSRIPQVEHAFFSIWPTEAGMSRASYAKASTLGKVLHRLSRR